MDATTLGVFNLKAKAADESLADTISSYLKDSPLFQKDYKRIREFKPFDKIENQEFGEAKKGRGSEFRVFSVKVSIDMDIDITISHRAEVENTSLRDVIQYYLSGSKSFQSDLKKIEKNMEMMIELLKA
jgi:hypothetical protein